MKKYLFLLFSLFILSHSAVFAQDCNQVASTATGLFWDRPIETGPSISTLGPVEYHLYGPFTVDVTGAYTILSTQDFDGYLHLYENAFDPTMQLVNLIAADDDGPGVFTSEIAGITLTAGTDYFLVTSGFQAGVGGNFTTSFSGPGNVICPSNAPEPVPIPTMGEWGLIILTLLLLITGTIYIGRTQGGFATVKA